MLDTVELVSGKEVQRSIIWLHGLGADANDFVPVVEELDLGDLPAVRFVFPNAPMRPVTINGGYVMRAWYDIVSTDFEQRREDPAGVHASTGQLEALIARENARGIADRHIVLAGFSQGGAIVLHTGLRHRQRLAGILALSTYVPLADTLAAEAATANADVPVFMAHGRGDAVIPYAFSTRSRDLLLTRGQPLDWHEYPMGHEVCMDEIDAIGAWLRRVLND